MRKTKQATLSADMLRETLTAHDFRTDIRSPNVPYNEGTRQLWFREGYQPIALFDEGEKSRIEWYHPGDANRPIANPDTELPAVKQD